MPQTSEKKIGRSVLRILLLLVLVCNILVILLQCFQGTELLARLPLAVLEVSGGSMEPSLHDGDGLMTVRSDFSRIKTGDVITFVQDNELITHEVISVQEGKVITQGTANTLPDGPVTEDSYCAKVLFRIPKMRSLWRIYTDAPRFLVFAVLVILLIFGSDIFPALYSAAARKQKKQ